MHLTTKGNLLRHERAHRSIASRAAVIFEVRGHDIDVSLRDCEKMARLEFYRMSEDCVSEPEDSQYDNQTLKRD
jgi:hypothetical protein